MEDPLAIPHSSNISDIIKTEYCDEEYEHDSKRRKIVKEEVYVEENSHPDASLCPNPLETNYVYQLLKAIPEGKYQMKCYDFESVKENYAKVLKVKKGCTLFCINAVAKIIVLHELDRIGRCMITPQRFCELAELANAVFPKYSKASFYSPSKPGVNARGALQSYYGNHRRNLILLKLLVPRKEPNRPNEPKEVESTEIFEELRTPDAIIDDEYKEKWNTVAREERFDFYKKHELADIFAMFPNLRSPLGYLLIQEDFSAIFQKPKNMFEQSWSSLAPKIVILAKTKTSDLELREFLKSHASIVKQKNHDLLGLAILPFIFPKMMKQTVKSKTGKTWVPDKQIIANSFMYHLKDAENLSESLKNIRNELEDIHARQHLTIESYVVLIVGPTLDNISAAYVVIGDVTYQVPNAIAAIGICFQCMKVLDQKFPAVSVHIWQFIECKIFGFEKQNLYSGVVNLINKLEKL